MTKTRYHIERSHEYGGWEVCDSTGFPVNDEPFKTRGEALRFMRELRDDQDRAEANDRYWARLESYHEDRYELGD